ncbi:hypothetical protein NDU88_004877 [Pleurodeles waltl]|uniref:Uncharacterized protein n=1 Tax=Pleurodeles waltl TaxID=8319 RepID=A0AAV7WBN5_PLEWA|nr:hypothetical protein NDU88_004877 [Pleurodeles waltl]
MLLALPGEGKDLLLVVSRELCRRLLDITAVPGWTIAGAVHERSRPSRFNSFCPYLFPLWLAGIQHRAVRGPKPPHVIHCTPGAGATHPVTRMSESQRPLPLCPGVGNGGEKGEKATIDFGLPQIKAPIRVHPLTTRRCPAAGAAGCAPRRPSLRGLLDSLDAAATGSYTAAAQSLLPRRYLRHRPARCCTPASRARSLFLRVPDASPGAPIGYFQRARVGAHALGVLLGRHFGSSSFTILV